MAEPRKRKHPVLTVTVQPDVKARIGVLAGKIPGASVSGIVRELLGVSLPMMEQAIAVLEEARQADGSIDEPAARQAMGAWIGTQLLTLYDTQRKLGEEVPQPM